MFMFEMNFIDLKGKTEVRAEGAAWRVRELVVRRRRAVPGAVGELRSDVALLIVALPMTRATRASGR